MDFATLGKLVRRKRKWLELTQVDLAAEARINVSTLQRLERGNLSDIHVMKLNRIFRALDITFTFSIDEQP